MTYRKASLRSIFALALMAAAATPAMANDWVFSGEPGDYISQGTTQSYSGTEITASASTDKNVISISANTPDHWWYLDFAAPAGQELAVGTYNNATRHPFQDPGVAGISQYGDGRGCNQNFGNFTVHEVEYGPYGYLVHLRATYSQRCESLSAPELIGEVIIDNPPPPAALVFTVTADNAGLVNRLSGVVTLSGTITCSTQTTANIGGSLAQRSGRRNLASGNFDHSIACGPTATKWSANVSSYSIPFGQGPAQLDINANAYDTNYGGYQLKTISTVVSLATTKRTVVTAKGITLK